MFMDCLERFEIKSWIKETTSHLYWSYKILLQEFTILNGIYWQFICKWSIPDGYPTSRAHLCPGAPVSTFFFLLTFCGILWEACSWFWFCFFISKYGLSCIKTLPRREWMCSGSCGLLSGLSVGSPQGNLQHLTGVLFILWPRWGWRAKEWIHQLDAVDLERGHT